MVKLISNSDANCPGEPEIFTISTRQVWTQLASSFGPVKRTLQITRRKKQRQLVEGY